MESILCPFCESSGWIMEGVVNSQRVRCLACQSRGPVKKTQREALESWVKVSEKVNEPAYKYDGKF